MVGAVSLDVVEGGQHGVRIGYLVDLAPDRRVRRRHRRGIEPQIEQRGGDDATPDVGQLAVDPGLAAAIETGHQRAVEENEIGHGRSGDHGVGGAQGWRGA